MFGVVPHDVWRYRAIMRVPERDSVPRIFRTRRKSIMPKVGLEPTPSCEDRILSPVRLPYLWYWKHVAVILIVLVFRAVTRPP